MRKILLASAAFFALLPSLASAQVAVAVSGPRSNVVLRDTVRAIERAGFTATAVEVDDEEASEIAAATGSTTVVLASVSRRGGRWRVNATLHSANGAQVGEADAAARGLTGASRAFARKVAEQVGSVATPEEPLERRRVVIGEVGGPPNGAGRARSALVQAFESRPREIELLGRDVYEGAARDLGVSLDSEEGVARVCAETGVAAYVTGQVSRRGRRWIARFEVRDGSSGRVVGSGQMSAASPSALARAVGQSGFRELRDGLSITITPDAPAAPVVEVPDPEEPEDDEEAEELPDDAGERAYVAFDLGVYMHLFSRKLRYNDDLYRLMRTYTLQLGPAVRFDGRWYPGAHFGDGFYAHIGFEFMYERAFGIDSKRADGETFPTSSRSWLVGLRGRMPFGDHEASVGVGYGLHSFVVEAAGPSQPGREIIPQVPGVTYRYLKLQAEGRFALVAGLRATVRAAWLQLFDLGGVESEIWFPRASAGGMEAEILVGYELDAGLEIRLGFDVRRYFFSMNPEVGDPFIAGGALDQYFGYTLGAAYRY
ncbi:MAG: hypothetical protein H6722_14000 [Sandaracinus sp.]|nr:hypothetical protein [Sandaracinus sp.]MCB9625049.1 hypothetical protein [Sandaracinus sp.]